MASPAHLPVLLAEVLELLQPHSGGRYVDCTLGAGGHAEAVLQASSPDGVLLGIDADPEALRLAAARLSQFGPRARLVHGNYRDLGALMAQAGFGAVDGILLDLGVSSMQLDQPARGFSFQQEGPLDMRLDPGQGAPAAELVNTLPERELADLIFRYGEERLSRRIARAIVARRTRQRFETTTDLARVVAASTPGRGRIHPATRTFQALRIAVNDELQGLTAALPAAAAALAPGGRLAVIAFHSMEDRIVKQFVRQEGQLHAVTKKPVAPSAAEAAANPRSRSAKLRVAEKLGPEKTS